MEISDMLHDLTREILLRLPVKTLLRLRCVCKTWAETIDHPEFFSHGSNTHPRKLLMLSFGHMGYYLASDFGSGKPAVVEEYPLPELEQLSRYSLCLTSSCNGVFCIYQGEKVALFNPTTRQFKTLGPSPRVTRYSLVKAVALGLDRRTNDLRVFRIARQSNQEPFLFEVYSLAEDTWREIQPISDLSLVENLSLSCYKTTFSNGVYYWIAAPSGTCAPDDDPVILSFDFSREVLELEPLPAPDSPGYGFLFVSIGLLRGCVALVLQGPAPDRLDVWKLITSTVSDGGGKGLWCKEISLPSPRHYYCSIGFWNDRVVLGAYGGTSVFWSYDLSTMKMEKVGLFGDRTIMRKEYLQSLVSLR